ncbi:MAG: endonuclease/exonuclease/phosphatase family protein [Spirulinaceae cyanobacterium]
MSSSLLQNSSISRLASGIQPRLNLVQVELRSFHMGWLKLEIQGLRGLCWFTLREASYAPRNPTYSNTPFALCHGTTEQLSRPVFWFSQFIHTLAKRIIDSGLRWGLNGLAAIATLCTVLSLFTSWHWVFALLEHPRPQYCLGLLLILLWAVLTRRWGYLLWGVPLVVNLWLMGPGYWQPRISAMESGHQAPTLTLIQVNLDRHNTIPEQAIAFLQAHPADWVWLQEVTPDWLVKLRQQLPMYRVLIAQAQTNSQGVALLQAQTPSTPLPTLQTEIRHFPPTSPRPMIVARLRWQGEPITLLGLHTTRPRSADTAAFQQAEFATAAAWLQHQPHAIVLGDFNATPWSRPFQDLLNTSGLMDSLPGWGWQGSWPAGLPPLMRLPIDHCLHDPMIQVRSRRMGPAIGSDHLPLIVTWQLAVSSPLFNVSSG